MGKTKELPKLPTNEIEPEQPVEVGEVAIELPELSVAQLVFKYTAPNPETYARRRIDCRLSPKEKDTLHRIVTALDRAQARLVGSDGTSNGKRVTDANTAIRFLLQQMGTAIEKRDALIQEGRRAVEAMNEGRK